MLNLRLSILIGCTALLLAQSSGMIGQESPDDGTLCGPQAAKPRVHECHCAGMVDRAKQAYQDECGRKPTKQERDACRDAQPETCHIMDHPDSYLSDVASGERCLRACRQHQCTCNEGACFRQAVLTHPPKARKGRRK